MRFIWPVLLMGSLPADAGNTLCSRFINAMLTAYCIRVSRSSSADPGAAAPGGPAMGTAARIGTRQFGQD
jgi:hypothetical protein